MPSHNQLLLSILQEGATPISNTLLTNYQKIGLSDQEMMLIVHLLFFQSKGNNFPSISQLVQRMSHPTEGIVRILQRLVKQGYIYIEENKEENTGILYESYNLTPLFLKIISVMEYDVEKVHKEKEIKEREEETNNLYQIFEREFSRPLSPMEIEIMSTWIDEDKHTEEIVTYALRESVYANKLNFRYIDRILFEWKKKNIQTVDQIKQHAKQFRSHQEEDKKDKPSSEYPFEFYNWLENE